MSEQKEVCPKCGSVDFGILRDMTSRRVCKCGHGWDAPEKKDTGYKRLKRESEEYFAKWGEYMKRAHTAEAKVEELKFKLEKAEKVIASISLDFKTYGLFHYDDCASLYDEDEKCSCGAFSAENRINKAIREYLKGEERK